MIIHYQVLHKPGYEYSGISQRSFHSYTEAQDHIDCELEEWETDCVFIHQDLWVCPPDCPF